MKYFKKVIVVFFIMNLSFILISCQKSNKVYFQTNGGESLKSSKIKEYSDFNSSHIPNKDGYVFMGWYVDENLEIEYKPDEHNSSPELRLYAKWQIPSNFTREEIVNLYIKAYDKHVEAKNMEVVAEGLVKTSAIIVGEINQRLKSTKKVNDSNIYQLTASYSSLAAMFFEVQGTKEDITLKTGEANSKLEIGKVKNEEKSNEDLHREKYGVLPNELNYIVNDETVVEAKEYVYSNNKHQFTLILDNEKSVVNYLKNIKATNQYDSKPAIFESIKLIVVIGVDGYFEKITYNEKYTVEVKAPIIGWSDQPMNGNITEIFKYTK
ncbi:InlB B-repeat-containing protein [Haploplasma axanthum]|uniref:Repeat n=1 Tax=Haploplasma axanthum TaxID=29552 RepID=A0A449BBV4_HAPAX|nr:InlB B-repeat-containing protein [Haploplasma axanthum]VEU79934.1 repeat [Haploplasma axanthum]